jgi:hypothetical protein
VISGRLYTFDCANQPRWLSGPETHLPLCLGPFHAACSGAPSPAAARQHHPSSTRPVLAQAADTLHPCECNRFCPSLHLLSALSTLFSSWPTSSHSFVCPRPCLHLPLHSSLLPVARLRSVASTSVVLLSLLILSGLRSPLLVLSCCSVPLFLSNPRPPWQTAPRSDCLPLTTRRTHSRACTPGLAIPPAPRHR